MPDGFAAVGDQVDRSCRGGGAANRVKQHGGYIGLQAHALRGGQAHAFDGCIRWIGALRSPGAGAGAAAGVAAVQ